MVHMQSAQKAIKQYALQNSSISFIGHNENITFCVLDHTSQQKYLLRIHKPINAQFAQRQSIVLDSELLWLEALARDTPLIVQQPVRNMQGQFVTYIQMEDGHTPCTLLKWIDGESFKQRAEITTSTAMGLGYAVALLHQHTKSWQRPGEFMRPSYDLAYFRRQIASLSDGVDAEVFSARNCVVMQRMAESILTIFASLDNDNKDQWGLIHCDLHYGNYLLCQGKVCPIDFSLCGFGYFLFDIGTCLAALPGVEQQAFLNSYTRQLQHSFSSDQLHIIKSCSFLSRICAFAFALPNPLQHPFLKERIPRFITEECQAFF